MAIGIMTAVRKRKINDTPSTFKKNSIDSVGIHLKWMDVSSKLVPSSSRINRGIKLKRKASLFKNEKEDPENIKRTMEQIKGMKNNPIKLNICNPLSNQKQCN